METDGLLFDLNPTEPAKRPRKPAVKHDVNPEAAAERELLRRLGALLDRYSKTVRFAGPSERTGVIRNMRLAIQKGLTVEQLETATTVYTEDPWYASSDPRFRKTIRSFYLYDNLLLWLKPVEPRAAKPNRDASLDVLDRLNHA
jgi:hypothetical protein